MAEITIKERDEENIENIIFEEIVYANPTTKVKKYSISCYIKTFGNNSEILAIRNLK